MNRLKIAQNCWDQCISVIMIVIHRPLIITHKWRQCLESGLFRFEAENDHQGVILAPAGCWTGALVIIPFWRRLYEEKKDRIDQILVVLTQWRIQDFPEWERGDHAFDLANLYWKLYENQKN